MECDSHEMTHFDATIDTWTTAYQLHQVLDQFTHERRMAAKVRFNPNSVQPNGSAAATQESPQF